jgi:hypothetical protein
MKNNIENKNQAVGKNRTILGANDNDDDDEKTENAYLARFPGLKPLYIAKKNDDSQQRVQTRTCMNLTVYSLMILFSGKSLADSIGLILFLRVDTSENFYAVDIINNMFTVDFKGKNDMEEVILFLKDVGDELLANDRVRTLSSS